MLFCRSQAFVLLPTTLFIFFTFCSSFGAASYLQPLHSIPISGGFEEGLVSWRRSVLGEGASPSGAVNNTPLILAKERTHRKDPLDGYKRYNGGWNISNRDYWASVGFTAVPLFVIALIWFVGFGLALLLICCCYCCFPRRRYGYSRTAYALSLIFLIFFTIAAIIGCIVLYNGQGKFHGSTGDTLDYVVKQANLTVDNLKNFSKDLATARNVGVEQVFMPADVQARIDKIEKRLNGSANDLAARTQDNSKKIQDLLDSVRIYLIIVAAVMLLLAFLGFLFSVVGLQVLVYFLVLLGWFLVAGTFILCGVFLLLHNVVADTCVAMEEWVQNPHAHTALDDILPCVDFATANESLYQSKDVTYQLVNIVNQVISNVANKNFPPNVQPVYYNQSGPLMPLLCNPFTSNLTARQCVTGEVDLNSSTQAWRNYVCQVSSSGICTTTGRVTPSTYTQMTAAANLSYSIYHYGPLLVQLEDCTFVRDTFSFISAQDCPGLQQYSKWIYIGLVMVSAAVMLSLIFWVIYARERRHRKNTKQFIQRSSQEHYQDKGP
ncbi:hypothetical protein MRB53_017938 [Persea americana]|uniref:Uncharacterized protein n=1 Tax=Persea americana TaxID=3435 RepID=A0ACC2M6E2_PERAE|nr:hypothetical protein MRB53_017938 [Persea americana]